MPKTDDQISEMLLKLIKQYEEGGTITLACGCTIDANGKCPCGNESPLVIYGLIDK